jgi:hypothetical protein
VQVIPSGNTGELSKGWNALSFQEGQVICLSKDGSLKLHLTGEIVNLQFGEVRLRPVKNHG